MRRGCASVFAPSGATSAGPYGYTLAIWGSGMVAAKALGSPGLGEVLLFVAGAVGAFVTVEALAYRGLHPRPVNPNSQVMAIWGSAHLPAAASAIALVWVTAQTVTSWAAWPIAGFLATVTYLLLNAIEGALAAHLAKSRARRRSLISVRLSRFSSSYRYGSVDRLSPAAGVRLRSGLLDGGDQLLDQRSQGTTTDYRQTQIRTPSASPLVVVRQSIGKNDELMAG